jgi:undecaprenyl-diphosphatase
MFSKSSSSSKIEAEVLIPFFIVVVCLLLFIFIANLVQLGKTKSFDDWILLSLRNNQNVNQPIGPQWLEIAMINITSLGSAVIITLITIIVVGYLIFQKNYFYIFVVLFATIGGTILVLLLKNFFGRERPELVPHLVYAVSFSFPSGHSMMSAVVYLTQASLISKIQKSKSLKIYILTIAIILTVLIGLSRIYLGVHYPTDVLAGWALGTAWAYICWLLANYFTEKGLVRE